MYILFTILKLMSTFPNGTVAYRIVMNVLIKSVTIGGDKVVRCVVDK